MKPYLRIDRFTYLNSHPTVVVTNVGIGPAFVDRYWVALDGDEVKRDKFPAASEAVKKLDIHDQVNTYTPEGTDVLSPRENWTLLEIHNAPTDIDTTGALATQLKRIRFDIEYHSIYGERDSTNK